MKKTLLLFATMLFGFGLIAQTYKVKSSHKIDKPKYQSMSADLGLNSSTIGKEFYTPAKPTLKNTDVVSIISIGTSANAFGYGYGGGQKNLLNYNTELNLVTNFHRMGGELDPGGYSGDMGYDVSFDGGLSWTNMVECYVATENAGGEYFLDAGRYPNHGVYNPAGNTDPNAAYVTFFAPNLDGSNESGGFGGYSYGRARIGDVLDTTKHLKSTNPGDEIYQYTPDGFCITNLGDVWVSDVNGDYGPTPPVFMGSILVNHGVWDEAEMDFIYEEILFEHDMRSGLDLPAFQDVEFAPDGLTGYILTLSDDGSVPISTDQSFYPIIWRTEDGGETWSEPIPVALAGDEGIGAVQGFLTDGEIAELFDEPVPDREEIPFTTGFDCDLSVDMYGNPHIAVVCGVTGSDLYSIVSDRSDITHKLFTCAFLLSSMDRGEEESWVGYELGRPVSFRGTFDTDFDEDNRIQISRDPAGTKMFVSWLDTDTTVASDNTAPDIWTRGVDVVEHILTVDEDGEPLPVNVTFGSEATFAAYFFAQTNEVITDDEGNYVIPYTYENMVPNDPGQPVQFKYIQDFSFNDDDFLWVGIDDKEQLAIETIEVSEAYPNPAKSVLRFGVNCLQSESIRVVVVNLMGQIAKKLPSQNYQTGSNVLQLDLSGMTPGVYFVNLNTNDKTIARKVIVE